MFQVGQTVTLQGTVVAGQDISYVWKFWDGSVHVTAQPFTQKVINKGGTVTYDLLAIDAEAQIFQTSGSIAVNAPPVITSLGLSENDAPAPFDTVLTSGWMDPDSAGPITVMFDTQTQVVGSPGISTIDYTVTESKTVILSGTDPQGGVTRFPIELRVAPTPLISMIGSTNPLIGRIGPGQTVRITAFAEEQNGESITQFQWILETTNGWASDRTYTTPTDSTIVDQGGGGFSAFIDLAIAVETPGAKTIRLKAFTDSSSVEISVPLTLVANAAPIVDSFSMSGTIGFGQTTTITANATEPDGDVMSFAWSFNKPPATTRSGNPVSVVLSTGSVIEGTVVVNDTLGASTLQRIPKILITSAVIASGVRGLAFNYALTAMGYSPVIFSASGLPIGLTLNGNLISGTPSSFGNVDVLISASSSDGVDVRTLKLIIAEDTPPPPPPTNLQVNGNGTNPTYTAAQDLVVTYTITNDLPNLSSPGASLELRTTTGELKLTVETASGIQTATITNLQIQTAFGSLPSLIIRAYSIRAGVRSQFYQELTVVRV